MKTSALIIMTLALALSGQVLAAGFSCAIKHGPYRCYRNPAQCETSATIDLEGSSARTTIQLVPSDGREIMLIEELEPMTIIKASEKRFQANRVESEDGPVILGEIDLTRKGDLWAGTLYTDGVEFNLTCQLEQR